MAVRLAQEVVAKELLCDMLRKLIFTGVNLLFVHGFGQPSIDDVLNQLNDQSVAYIQVEELSQLETAPILLDVRETAEYNVSHLKNAILVGFNNFEISEIESRIKDKNKKIVVYCSIGVRSELIGKQLLAEGYTNVYNLYGGIFEWVNKGEKVYTNKLKQTPKVHAYSKKWSAYLLKGIKVYD